MPGTKRRQEQRVERLYYRPAEAAEAISVSVSKMYDMLNRGEVPSVRIGGCLRVPVKALEALGGDTGTGDAGEER